MSRDILSNYYLSALTPLGFVSRTALAVGRGEFDRIFLLKGGTAALRSQLISDAAHAAEKQGQTVSRVLCPLADDRLEAAFWGSTAVIDSAQPYGIEPLLPSALEDIVWLGDCYDSGLRKTKNELADLADRQKAALEQSRKLLFAADELLKFNSRAVLDCCDTDKISAQAARAAKKHLRRDGKTMHSAVSHRQFGAAEYSLPDGFSLVLLQDTHLGCGRFYLRKLLEQAKQLGSAVYSLFSPFSPYSTPDILIFPESHICFALESDRFTFSQPADSIINSRRYTDRQRFAPISRQLKQNLSAADQLYARAKQHFEKASCFRQKKEEIYNYYFDTAVYDNIRHTFFANMV